MTNAKTGRSSGKSAPQSDIDKKRTQLEKQEVVQAPFAWELAAAAKAIVQLLQKIPIQFREAAVLAVIGVLEGVEAMLDALVNKLPGESSLDQSQRVRSQAAQIRAQIKSLPLDQEAPVLKQGVKLIDTIETMVGSPESLAIDVPHFFTTDTINHQFDYMVKYIQENAFK